MNVLTVGSVFSGIGGLDLGMEWTGGFRHAWFCESDPSARAELAATFPGVPIYEDIRELRGSDVEPVDVLAGGFPCQDISLAGAGAGLAGARSGLWFEQARVLRELGCRYLLVENVDMLLQRGAARVLGDLAAMRFDAEWACLRAAHAGAPHRRERFFLLAYPHGWAERGVASAGEARGAELADGDEGGRLHGEAEILAAARGFHAQRDPRAGRRPPRAPVHEWPPGYEDDAGWASYLRRHPGVEPAVRAPPDGVPGRAQELGWYGNAVVPWVGASPAERILQLERGCGR